MRKKFKVLCQRCLFYFLDFNPENFAIYSYKKRPDGKLIDRFNISEDWRSESQNSKLIKQTHGPIKLMHSLPAVKLHPQFVSFFDLLIF